MIEALLLSYKRESTINFSGSGGNTQTDISGSGVPTEITRKLKKKAPT